MNTLCAVHQLNLREMKRIWPTLIRAVRYLQLKKGNVLMRETFHFCRLFSFSLKALGYLQQKSVRLLKVFRNVLKCDLDECFIIRDFFLNDLFAFSR